VPSRGICTDARPVPRADTGIVTEPLDDHSERQLQFLRVLLEENAWINNDILEISQQTWMIHGVFPYNGEVPMAVFDSPDEAQHVLDQVRVTTRPSS